MCVQRFSFWCWLFFLFMFYATISCFARLHNSKSCMKHKVSKILSVRILNSEFVARMKRRSWTQCRWAELHKLVSSTSLFRFLLNKSCIEVILVIRPYPHNESKRISKQLRIPHTKTIYTRFSTFTHTGYVEYVYLKYVNKHRLRFSNNVGAGFFLVGFEITPQKQQPEESLAYTSRLFRMENKDIQPRGSIVFSEMNFFLLCNSMSQ